MVAQVATVVCGLVAHFRSFIIRLNFVALNAVACFAADLL